MNVGKMETQSLYNLKLYVCCALSPQWCPTLCDHVDGTRKAPLSMGLPGKNTGVGCHLLLQGSS